MELRFNSLVVHRLEEAAYNNFSFAVDVRVGHVLFSGEPIGSLQGLYPGGIRKRWIKEIQFYKQINISRIALKDVLLLLCLLILPHKVLDKLQLAVDWRYIFMNYGDVGLKAKREQSHRKENKSALGVMQFWGSSSCAAPGKWREPYLLKSKLSYQIFLPVRSTQRTFDSCHYVQFVRLLWITTIFIVLFCSLCKNLLRKQQLTNEA